MDLQPYPFRFADRMFVSWAESKGGKNEASGFVIRLFAKDAFLEMQRA